MIYRWVFFLGLLLGVLGSILFGIGIVTDNNDLTITSFVFIGITFLIIGIVMGMNCNVKPSQTQGEPPMVNPAIKRNKSDTNLELISGDTKAQQDLSRMYDDV